MKKNLLLLSFLMSYWSVIAQNNIFQKTYKPTNQYLEYQQVIQTLDKGYAILGYMESAGIGDITLTRTDKNGVILWSKRYGTDSMDVPGSMRATRDGGFIISGNTFSINSFTYGDIIYFKVNASGNLVWSKGFGSDDIDENYALELLPNGKIIIGGMTTGTFTQAAFGSYILQTDSLGNIEDARSVKIGQNNNHTIYTSDRTLDGGAILAGSVARGFSYDPMLIKLRADGTTQWVRQLNMVDGQFVFGVKTAPDSSYLLTGATAGAANKGGAIFIAKYSGDGTQQWVKRYDSPFSERGYDIAILSNNTFLVTGRAGVKIDANGSNTYNIPLLNANLSNGNLNWVKMYGDTAKNNYNQTVIPTADGGFTMAGMTFGFGDSTGAAYLIHTDAAGNTPGCNVRTVTPTFSADVLTATDSSAFREYYGGATVAVNFHQNDMSLTTNQLCLTVGTNDALSESFSMKIYPNPATDKTFIELQNGGKQIVVRVFDMTGKLYDSIQSAAERIELNTNAYPIGMYLIQVETDGKFQTKKLIIE
jgi:Secretion system C-terminal sorting domain